MSDTALAITAAFRRAVDKAGYDPRTLEAKIQRAVSDLMLIGSNPPAEGAAVKFRALGRQQTVNELWRVRRAADAYLNSPSPQTQDGLSRVMESLHRPAILLLADNGVLRGGSGPEWAARLAQAARAARATGIKRVPADVPHARPVQNFERAVAALVVNHYAKILGRQIGLPGDATDGRPGLHRLVKEVFTAFGITADPRAMERAAEERLLRFQPGP